MANLSATMKDEFRHHRWHTRAPKNRAPKNRSPGYVLFLELCRQH